MKDSLIVAELEGMELLSLDINYNGLSKSYRNSTDVTGRQFNEFVKRNDLRLTPDTVKQFLADIKSKLSPGTYNLKRQQLKNLLKEQPEIKNNYMLRGFVDVMFKDIKAVNMNGKRAKIENVDFLSKEQIDQMIESTENPKHSLIIEFLFKTGCRVSEMLDIRLTDVKLNSKAIITVIGKRDKARRVFITRELFEALRETFKGNEYLIEHNGKQYSRMQIFRIIRNAGHRIGYEMHPHTCRHSFAMHLKEQGKGIKYISKALGHASTQVTADHYFHESPGEEITDLF